MVRPLPLTVDIADLGDCTVGVSHVPHFCPVISRFFEEHTMSKTPPTPRNGMRILIVGRDPQHRGQLAQLVHQTVPQTNVTVFTSPSAAVQHMQQHICHVLFLDVRSDAPYDVGFVAQVQSLCPKCNLIFVADHNRYTGDAMALHASGYLTTPLTAEALKRELDDLRHPVQQYVLRVQCQGRFEVFLPNGEPVHFSRSKSQELFAYLVYRRGAGCTVRELTAVLFEDTPYNERVCRYLQTISASLMTTLRRVGAESVIDKRYNHMAVDMDKLDCDWDSDWDTSKLARRRFMLQYDWAGPETIVPPVQEGP